MSYNPFNPDERWEYEMFTEVLTPGKYPVKKQFAMLHSDNQLTIGNVQDDDHQLTRLIEKAVRNLLQRAGNQGWEAVDTVDADSLLTKGRVRFGEAFDTEDRSDGSSIVELTTIHIFCRRRIQFRNNAFVELSTESNPALINLEPFDDFPLE